MKAVVAAAVVLCLGSAALAGCGGDSADRAGDEQSIRDLIAQVNRATAGLDADAACDVIAPSSIRRQFKTKARCVRETGAILKQAGKQRPVEVESIEIDGDRARVTLKDRNGDVTVIRENGRWYVPIGGDQPETGKGPEGSEREP